MRDAFFADGWCRFPRDTLLERWVRRTLPVARDAVSAADNAQWRRYGGTWFVGVNALPNDRRGAVAGGQALSGRAVSFIHEALCPDEFDWDRAQVSVCYPGYPRPMPGESAAAFRFRQRRDAAHVDGLLAEGPMRRRHLREHHAFILGIPMVTVGAGASPFVVWEGSHELVREAFLRRFRDIHPMRWGDEDVTDTYHAVRKQVFEVCDRVEVAADPGEAYLAHRLCVHGMAPWSASATASSDGRMICYFRPEVTKPADWLMAP